jgi:hypothetical protein
MRDIRSRIAKRHGIDLTPEQIHELAARRLEAILEPRHVSPPLLEQMRRAAGQPIEVPPPPVEAPADFDEAALYASHRGFLRAMRRLLNPILKLFINPKPLVDGLRDQARRRNEAAAREAEFYGRQTEWNALHFEIVQRLVTEVARATIEMQSLALRVESLSAKVDFNERRVRSLEGAGAPTRPGPRPAESTSEPARTITSTSDAAPAPSSSSDPSSDGQRRRRRRRRGGRRPGFPSGGDPARGAGDAAQTMTQPLDADGEADGDLEPETDEGAPQQESPATVERTAAFPAREADTPDGPPEPTASRPAAVPGEEHERPTSIDPVDPTPGTEKWGRE